MAGVDCDEVIKLLIMIIPIEKKIYKWGKDCQYAFKELKKRLITILILAYSDFTKIFSLQINASDFGLRAVLAQKIDQAKDKVAASWSMTKTERNYTVTEKECLAVKIFWPYIYGREFEAITDHKALKWLLTLKEPKSRLARWSMELFGYNRWLIDLGKKILMWMLYQEQMKTILLK